MSVLKGVFAAVIAVCIVAGFAFGHLVRLLKVRSSALRQVSEELRVVHADLSERSDQLKYLNTELESFSYSISHDLRAPLRAVLGFSRILEEDYSKQLDAEGRRLLVVVDNEATRLGALIDDLLQLSRLGRRALQRDLVDMTSLVREIVSIQTELAPNPERTITVETLPSVYGDPTQLRLVWESLISNAIKYSHKRSKPSIRVRGAMNGLEVTYHVEDNGVGFDMQYADKLFGVFQRLHRDEEFPGTGVGLAIVQRVILRHRGRVWADARPDAGATFSFSLPREVEHGGA